MYKYIIGSECVIRCKKEYVDMGVCKAFEEMLKDERDEGRKEEREKNISVLIGTLKKLGHSKEVGCDNLAKGMNLADEQAREYVDMYWGS